jgi:translation initiation factor eIF-2B subunit delta
LIEWSKENIQSPLSILEMVDITSKKLKSFSSIQAFVKELKTKVNRNNHAEVLDFLNKSIDNVEKRYSILFNNSLSYLKDTRKIVTLSNSKTVIEILKRLSEQKRIIVTIAESRPKLEGRMMAKELLKNKIKVEIIPDAFLSNAVERCDTSIIGADIVLSNGNVVNKIGSRNLAILSKHFRKPFYVIATSDKFSTSKKYFPEMRDGKEIWNYKHNLLKKTNYYFEVVERKFITKVISD